MNDSSRNRKRTKSEELSLEQNRHETHFNTPVPRYINSQSRSTSSSARPQSVQIVRNPDKFSLGHDQRIFGSIKQRGEGRRSVLLSGSSSSSLTSPVNIDTPPPIPPRIKPRTSVPDIPPRQPSRSQRSSIGSSSYRSLSPVLSDTDNDMSDSISDVQYKIDAYNKKFSPYLQSKQHSPRTFRAENFKKAGSFSPRVERKRSRTAILSPPNAIPHRISERTRVSKPSVPLEKDVARNSSYFRRDVTNPALARRSAFVYKSKENNSSYSLKTKNKISLTEFADRENENIEPHPKRNNASVERKKYPSTEDELKPQRPQTDLTKPPIKMLSSGDSSKALTGMIPKKPKRPDKRLLRKIYQDNFYRFAGYLLDSSQVTENKMNSEPNLFSIFSRDSRSLQLKRHTVIPYLPNISLNLSEGKPLLLDFDNPYHTSTPPSPPTSTIETSSTLPQLVTRRYAMSNTKKKHRLSTSRSSLIQLRGSLGSDEDISRATRLKRPARNRPTTFHEDMFEQPAGYRDAIPHKTVKLKGKISSSAKVLEFVKSSSKGLSQSFVDLLSPTPGSTSGIDGENMIKSSASTSGSLFNLLGYRTRIRRDNRTPSIRSSQSVTTMDYDIDSIPENF